MSKGKTSECKHLGQKKPCLHDGRYCPLDLYICCEECVMIDDRKCLGYCPEKPRLAVAK